MPCCKWSWVSEGPEEGCKDAGVGAQGCEVQGGMWGWRVEGVREGVTGDR